MPCGFAPIDLPISSSPPSFALPPLLQHFLHHYVTQPLLISIAIVGAVFNLIRQQCVGSQRGYSFRTCGEEDRDAVNPVRQKKSSSLQQNTRLIKHNHTEEHCPNALHCTRKHNHTEEHCPNALHCTRSTESMHAVCSWMRHGSRLSW